MDAWVKPCCKHTFFFFWFLFFYLASIFFHFFFALFLLYSEYLIFKPVIIARFPLQFLYPLCWLSWLVPPTRGPSGLNFCLACIQRRTKAVKRNRDVPKNSKHLPWVKSSTRPKLSTESIVFPLTFLWKLIAYTDSTFFGPILTSFCCVCSTWIEPTGALQTMTSNHTSTTILKRERTRGWGFLRERVLLRYLAYPLQTPGSQWIPKCPPVP